MKYLFLLGILPMILLSSCKDDVVTPTDDFSQVTEYMIQQDRDLGNILDGWVTTAGAINVNPTDYSVPDYYVIDIRSADDFALGHIKGAHNTPLANIVDEAANAGSTPILVVCYTGQTAARATGMLRILGYDAKSLKWGMSAWHGDFEGKWTANHGDIDSPNWVFTGEPAVPGTFELPEFTTNESSPALMLEARVRQMLQKTTWGINKTDVLGNPGNYFVNNFWPEVSWNEFGHVNGAYRLKETLGIENLNQLDPNADIVTYCYTGQTSAIITAWLDVLGYNGKSMLFGANGIVHNRLVASDTDGAKKKSWNGEGNGAGNNFGYYDGNGNMHTPN